jgi:hypothetical protein
MISELHEKMLTVQKKLEDLPVEYYEDSQMKLVRLCFEFTSAITRCTSGKEDDPKFLRDLSNLFKDLDEKIQATRLIFKFSSAHADQNGVPSSEKSDYKGTPVAANFEHVPRGGSPRNLNSDP